MMQRIRLWGVGVFAGLLALLVIGWWLLAGWIIERAVEEMGTDLVGARVDLASAELDLFPLRVALNGLEVTNPDAPMTNAVEVRRIAAGVNTLPLLRRKVLIEELAVEGVQFGTPRERSGAIADAVATAEETATGEEASGLELPSFEPPDVDAILAGEELESLALIGEAQAEIDRAMSSWTSRLDSLPDEKRFQQYRERLGKLKNASGVGGALAAAKDMRAIQAEVKQDIDALKSATGDFQREVKAVEELAKKAASAPARDVQRLRDKYGLSPDGLANLSQPLLGPRIGELAKRALSWWKRAEPIVARIQAGDGTGGAEPVQPIRGPGVTVRFPERNPVPDFLIRQAKLSLELKAGSIHGTIDDITPDQPIHGKPLRLTFGADKLDGLRTFRLMGTVDRTRPGQTADDLTLHAAGLALEAVPLSESAQWGIELERGSLDLDVAAKRSGDEISADVSAVLESAQLLTHFAEEGPVPSAIARTLQGIRSFRLDARVRGTLESYSVDVSSDMDRLLGSAVTQLVGDKMRELEAGLRSGIGKKTSGPLANIQAGLGGLGGIGQTIGSRVDMGGDVLSTGGSGGTSKSSPLPGGVKLPF